uniref:Protein kinase domain-containing protein n=1 Tax=Seriola dumerili TaxID=41447 RepID=A0A3B4T9L9_SERDU
MMTSPNWSSKRRTRMTLYIISEELARCQFGAVHRCVEIATKKTFMAKFIKVKGTDRELVLREIEALNVASRTTGPRALTDYVIPPF